MTSSNQQCLLFFPAIFGVVLAGDFGREMVSKRFSTSTLSYIRASILNPMSQRSSFFLVPTRQNARHLLSHTIGTSPSSSCHDDMTIWGGIVGCWLLE